MCTFVILRRPDHAWPVLIAANRDEMRARPSLPPARHWPDRPDVVAGMDLQARGSWLGVNDYGLVAAIMNREGTLGALAGKRSRGELVLEALDHARAGDAAGALADLHPDAYRPFNLIVADADAAYWLRHGGDGEIRVHPVRPGLHMLSAADLDDPAQPRIAANLGRFREASAPDPAGGDWSAWRALLASHHFPGHLGPDAAMVVERPDGFETRSSALIAVPAGGSGAPPIWMHCEGRPDRTPFSSL